MAGIGHRVNMLVPLKGTESLQRPNRCPIMRQVATLDTVLAVLDLLTGEPQLGVREMARRAGISKSAVQRTASRLAEADLLARDGGGYRLGLRFLDFGVLVQARNDLLGAARPALRTLARISGENTYLGVLHQAQILYVGHVEGSGPPACGAEARPKARLCPQFRGAAARTALHWRADPAARRSGDGRHQRLWPNPADDA